MASDRDRVAEALPSYEIDGELGRGAFGVVWAGRHHQLHREVAVKVLKPELSADPAVRARFVAEARLLAALEHPHVVPVYDYVEHDGLCLLVMERLSGGTLRERQTQTVPFDQACALVVAACAGLQSAHAVGILHRDVKPENLLFSSRGTLKVTDFGIAKVLAGSTSFTTTTGAVLGTPAYMAPEQAQGGELGPPTDVYATATILYELLARRLPYAADNADALSLLYRHVHDDAEPLASVAPEVPVAIAAAVDRGLARAPDDRYPDAEAFGAALDRAAAASWGPEWTARTGVPLPAAGVVGRAATPEAASTPASSTAGTQRTDVPRRRSRWAAVAALAAAGLAIGIVAVVLTTRGSTSRGPSSGGRGSAPSGTTPTTTTERFIVNRTSAAAGNAVTVTSQGGCPSLPTGYANPTRATVALLKDPADTSSPNFGYGEAGVDTNGAWSAQLMLNSTVPPGSYFVVAACEAQIYGGPQRYYSGYVPVSFTVTG